ncbi:MAG TPA: ParA family protein [Jiangellaceae bacterium]|nr:ParA family protein [Jiangellaceae bacterium]
MNTQTTEALVPTVAAAKADQADVGEPDLGPTLRPKRKFPQPPPLEHHGPARVVALCNQKGGVGKTTTAINLGAALADYGRKVLLIDFDPQAALTDGLGFRGRDFEESSIYSLLMDGGDAAELVVQTPIPGMDLLPSHINLSAAELQLVTEVAREQALERAIKPLLPDYDVALIDCQPSLGMLTINALTAANSVIIPVECEYFALRGVALLLATIEKVQRRINPDLVIDGVVATRYDGRTVHGKEILERLIEGFGEQLFYSVIGRTVKFPETTAGGLPITTIAPSSPGAKAYRQLAREVLLRWASASTTQ